MCLKKTIKFFNFSILVLFSTFFYSSLSAATAVAGFSNGAIGEYTNTAHKADTLLSFSTLNITEAIITQESDDGSFGGTQGNDYDVTLTLRYSNGTSYSFDASVNWRDTQGSTLKGIGLIVSSSSIDDGSGYTLSAGHDKTYILATQGFSYSDGSTVSGNAATNGLLDALNLYVSGLSASSNASPSRSTITADPTSILANGTSISNITVQLKDLNDFNLSSGGDTVLLTASAGTLSSVTDNQDGSYSATLTSSNTVSTSTISGTLNGSNISNTASVSFTADSTAPVITDSTSGSSDVNENQTAVTSFTADESVTWSLSGTDSGLFAISSSGVLTFASAPDYENPADADTNNDYQLNIIATDAASNATTLAYQVNVLDLDDTAPVITDSTSGSSDVNENQTAVTSFTADESVTWSLSGTDSGLFAISSSGVLTFASAPDYENPADADTNNDYQLNIIATDAASNATTLAYQVNVLDLDDTAPVITDSTSGSSDVNENQTAVTSFTADESVTWSLSGTDSGLFAISSSGVLTFASAPDYENPADADTNNDYQLNIIATDAASNATTLAYQVNVLDLDDTAPVITDSTSGSSDVNENQTAVTSFTADESVTWSLSGTDSGLFAISSSGVLTFASAPDYENPADADTNNDYQLNIIATDAASNATTLAYQVNVLDLDDTSNIDSTAPVISVTSGTDTVELGATWTDAGATADGGETVTTSGSVDTSTVGTYTITYSATDASGNTGSETRTVTVVDTTAPVVTVTGDTSVTVELGSTYSDAGATATDLSGDVTVVSSGTVDTDTLGEYVITYTSTDASGNTGTATRTVTVVDTTAPVVTVTGDTSVTVELGSTYSDAGATATDLSGDVTVVSSGTVDTDTLGEYVITYTSTDASGNTGTATRTVTVVDTTAPVISVTSGTDTVELGATWTDAGATADGGETVTTSGSVDTSTVGTYTITYSATDAAGNETSVTRTVTVVDTTAPVVTVTGDTSVTVELGSTYSDAGATADGGETVTTSGSVDTSTVGTYTITYSATDAAGNETVSN